MCNLIPYSMNLPLPPSSLADRAHTLCAEAQKLEYPPEYWTWPGEQQNKVQAASYPSVWRQLTGEAVPPSTKALPFSWDPEELTARSSELLAIHKTIIFKELSKRQGVGAEIDLFEWFWKDVVQAYLLYIAEACLTPPELVGVEPLWLWRQRTGEEADRKREEAEAFVASLKPDTRVAFDDIIPNLDGTLHCFYDDFATWAGGVSRLGFTGAFCKLSDPSSATLESNFTDIFSNNEPLKLRLLYWWGWKDARFMCMQRMISEHIENMLLEGYIRQRQAGRNVNVESNTYELTEFGRQRLQELDPQGKIGLQKWLKTSDLPALGANLATLCQFLWPR